MITRTAAAVSMLLSVWMYTSLLSAAEAPGDDIWVSIDATIKGVGLPTVTYYGAINREVFEKTLERTLPSGFIRLTHVGWMEGGKVHWLAEVTDGGATVGFSDVMYLRIESVTRIVELDRNFVKQQMLRTK